MSDNNSIKVSVLMPTYNHEKYIEQAIEAYLCQQCYFPIELIISDDASVDGTSIIAKKYALDYPEKIQFYKQNYNLGLLGNYKFLLEKAKGKYIAILESDDYWIDPLKLQKQVSILDSNPDCGFVYTSAIVIDENGTEKYRQLASINGDIYSKMLTSHFMLAVTICFSKEKFDKYCNVDEYIQKNFSTFDHPTLLALAANSTVECLTEETSVYRWIQTSISNNSDYTKIRSFFDSIDEIEDYITQKYGLGYNTLNKIRNAQQFRRIEVAIRNRVYDDVFIYSRRLKIIDIRSVLMRLFPWLWILKNKYL